MYEVAFLRGINVGNRRVTNAQLLECFEQAGATGAVTFQAAGNVVFEPGSADRHSISAALASGLGFVVDTYIRTAAELAEVATRGPFAATHVPDDATLAVTFLHEAPPVAVAEAVAAHSTAEDDIRIVGRDLHWLARRKLSGTTADWKSIGRLLGDPGTNRNINTVRKIVAKF